VNFANLIADNWLYTICEARSFYSFLISTYSTYYNHPSQWFILNVLKNASRLRIIPTPVAAAAITAKQLPQAALPPSICTQSATIVVVVAMQVTTAAATTAGAAKPAMKTSGNTIT